jgi:hypothetical protein
MQHFLSHKLPKSLKNELPSLDERAAAAERASKAQSNHINKARINSKNNHNR